MFQKIFPAEIESLYAMLEFIEGFGKDNQVDSLALNQMILATEEALVNIISYGYPDTKKGTIEISCEKFAPQPSIQVIIKDQGVPFNPIEKAPKAPPFSHALLNATEKSLGGYGNLYSHWFNG